MQQLVSVWSALSVRKRVIVALASVGMFMAVYGLARVATQPSMALLYAGIDEGRAGEVLTALDQLGAAYDVRGNAIYVPSDLRDRLRMDLAAQGLPANSGEGYELLDSLSGFGTTSQMFDAAYWRAKEGELARTIGALPGVHSVRVHISNDETPGFRQKPSPKASVTAVTAGSTISADQARALRYLVSSAVAGMKPQDVAVIDGLGRLIRSDDDTALRAGDDRAAELRAKVLRLLEARVGAGKAMVEVSVDTITDSEAITERQIDPQARVAIASETEEKSATSSNKGAGAVTVASNLPSGNAGGTDRQAQSNDSQTSERINYDVSETRRELIRAPGAVRRVTVAVMVDGLSTTDASGQNQWAPRPEEELAALHDLVAAAVGFDSARGDVITIKTLAFEPQPVEGSGPASSLIPPFALDVMTLIQLGVLALVTLVLGLFVLRPILASRSARPGATATLAAPAAASGPVLNGIIEDDEIMPDIRPQRPSARVGDGGQKGDGEISDPVARLRRLINERQDETVEILRSWMDDPETEKS